MATIDFDAITITDHFMFGTVFRSHEELCKELLEMALGVSIDHISYVEPERSLDAELGGKGIRMDVYVADEEGTVYDVEIQNADSGNLAKRSRFYLSANDYDCIEKGTDYADMHDSYVLFFCTIDPLKRNRAVYTIVPYCREDGVEMNDGTTRLFFNAKAWEVCENKGIRSFLRYLQEGIIGDSDFNQRVDEAVKRTRRQPEWRRTRMRLEHYLAEERAAARREGREEEQSKNERLARALVDAGREAELVEAMLDQEVRARLLDEFHIA